ncbi:hypothetical protein SAMN06295967_11456 [Belliella buryatensis]|uniref:Uncharacterized protein n=1 Tax=Belliella buryatensis TaxID=1500549 RepID=A0A239FZX7_9BACT|nr:hypothetical protein SAMN06295967_11456 [Belliella buryatensis]
MIKAKRLKIQNCRELLFSIRKFQIGNIITAALHRGSVLTTCFVFCKNVNPLEITTAIMHGIAQPCVEKHIEYQERYFYKRLHGG